ncbi:hypothetical protein NHP190003_04340 [Helicobacter sp. NHP19-003]|uniref:Uncharacterized protein n=1 Tax=Helicobacter gastrocanis TaxID=2849641 RepID=A0ABN6I2C3_9HELI|nr:hypothetical protein NHP190003_04340 [Helicobacter sp. NHP19-003]
MWLGGPDNIKANNKYFKYFDGQKGVYANSQYLKARALATNAKSDWFKADTEKCNEDTYQTLRKFFLENL